MELGSAKLMMYLSKWDHEESPHLNPVMTPEEQGIPGRFISCRGKMH